MKQYQPMSIQEYAWAKNIDIAKLSNAEFKNLYKKYEDYLIKRQEALERQKARQ